MFETKFGVEEEKTGGKRHKTWNETRVRNLLIHISHIFSPGSNSAAAWPA
jgi:hypothetical protein